MIDDLRILLHVAVHQGGGRAESDLVGCFTHIQPLLRVRFGGRDALADPLGQNLGAAARYGAYAFIVDGLKDSGHIALFLLCHEQVLGRTERMNMNRRAGCPDGPDVSQPIA